MDSNNFKSQNDEISSRADQEALGDNIDLKIGRRKRRSKNEKEGRSFICDTCGKSYLSQPALTNHSKSKHHKDDPDYKRGRGRPRKNPILNASASIDLSHVRNFFNKDLRRKIEGEIFTVKDTASEAIQELKSNYSDVILTDFDKIEDFKFYNAILNANPDKKHADDIFAAYILDVYSNSNKNYYIFIVKFVTLFRGCINRLKGIDYTTINGADSVPDLCNDFITEFMENNQNFGLDTCEVIDLIQHFCNWLYDNKFTTSRLTLLS